MATGEKVGKCVLDAIIEPVILVTTELKLAEGESVSRFQLTEMRMSVPSEDLNQLSEVFGHHGYEEVVEVLPLLEIDHKEVNELTGLDLILVSCTKLQ